MPKVDVPRLLRRPSAILGWSVSVTASAIWVVLRLVVFNTIIFPLTYALPLFICIWTRDKVMLWTMAAVFVALHALNQWWILPVRALPEWADWATYLATFFNIVIGAVAVHAIIVLRERLEGALTDIDAQATELERQNEELAQQSEEISTQSEEVSRQLEEISQQAEELSTQNEELHVQSDEIRELNTELAHREDLLQTLFDAARFSATEKSALQEICRAAIEMLGPPASAVAVYELQGEELVICAAAGVDESAVADRRQSAANRFARLVIDENRTACLNDASLRPDLDMLEVPGQPPFLAVLGAPLRRDGRASGAVSIYSREKHEWTTQQFRLAEWLAAQSAQVLEILRLHLSLRRQAALLDLTPDGIMTRRLDGTITSWRKGAERLYGFTKEEAIGRVSHSLLNTTFPHPLGEIEEQLRQTGRWTGELVHTAKDGREVHVESRWLADYDAQGEITELLESNVDVTERNRSRQAMQEANARLKEADRRKDEFIAILSHELRNPLAPIRYALPLLEKLKLDESAVRAVAVINRQVDNLTRLVDDLLDVSRITRGSIELRRQRVTLASVVTAAAEAATPSITAAGHTLKMAIADEPVWLHADPPRVAQIISNLLNNSAKYTPPGGEILVEATRNDSDAIIRVCDNGIGIPADALPIVFDMFRQVPRADNSQGGLGIGLAVVKRLVEMHGGTIEARSAGVGRGAEFTVRLPVAPEATAETDGVPPVPASRRRLRVLIVDDNSDLVEMLAIAVENCGHEILTASDGESAVSAAMSFRPHVILLDLGLPGVSGIEVARELRRHEELAGTRLVALTGWGTAEDRTRTREAGFDAHLTKPTEPEAVERLLAEFAGDSSA